MGYGDRGDRRLFLSPHPRPSPCMAASGKVKFEELGQIGLSREQLHGQWFVVTTTVGRFSAKIGTR